MGLFLNIPCFAVTRLLGPSIYPCAVFLRLCGVSLLDREHYLSRKEAPQSLGNPEQEEPSKSHPRAAGLLDADEDSLIDVWGPPPKPSRFQDVGSGRDVVLVWLRHARLPCDTSTLPSSPGGTAALSNPWQTPGFQS